MDPYRPFTLIHFQMERAWSAHTIRIDIVKQFSNYKFCSIYHFSVADDDIHGISAALSMGVYVSRQLQLTDWKQERLNT